ncbi:hypothetical protein DP62_5866 [Burkholderia pseudomallei]|nr:hypothetical protein DP62_5866 [Burkholderia pseudomallei]
MMHLDRLAENEPFRCSGRLMSAMQTLVRASQLFGYGSMHVDAKPLAESPDT